MATINGIHILVETEDPSYEIEVTEQPVESGLDLMDHVRSKAKTMNISGIIVSENPKEAGQIRQNILNLMEAGTLIVYEGRNRFYGILTSFRSTHTHQIADGMSFSASLKEVRIARTAEIGSQSFPVSTETAPVTVSGVQQPVETTNE